MANLFSNPLVVAENVIGTLTDRRAVVLYEQKDIEDAKGNRATTTIGKIAQSLNDTLSDFITRMDLKELFTGLDPLYLSKITGFSIWGITYESANLSIDSDLCEHPIETGEKITDAAILNPISAEVVIRMPTAMYTQIYEEIVKYYEEKKKILLLTKFGTYKNMVISAMPYALNHDEVDRPAIKLKLQQIWEVESSYVQTDSGTVKAIEAKKTLKYDDTSNVDVGRLHTNAIASNVSGGA